jgi:hypothetical protein
MCQCLLYMRLGVYNDVAALRDGRTKLWLCFKVESGSRGNSDIHHRSKLISISKTHIHWFCRTRYCAYFRQAANLMSRLLDHRRSIIHHGRSQVSSVQGKLVKDSRVVEKFCFLTVARTYTAAGKACLIPRILDQLLYAGVERERPPSLLRFILQLPRDPTFTNRLRMFYLFFFFHRGSDHQENDKPRAMRVETFEMPKTAGRTYRMTVARSMHVVSRPTFIRPSRIII